MSAFASSQNRKSAKKQAGDNVLAVINDLATGREYYVSLVDSFEFRGQDYCVMYHYRPEAGQQEPEIVFMRSYKGKDRNRYFCSIRDKNELALVFELFCQRYQDVHQSRA